MDYTYQTKGVCAQRIHFSLENGQIIHGVSFEGGCNGNLKAISKLVEGMDAKQVIALLKGNTCGPRPTSCADQFAQALAKALTEEKQPA